MYASISRYVNTLIWSFIKNQTVAYTQINAMVESEIAGIKIPKNAMALPISREENAGIKNARDG